MIIIKRMKLTGVAILFPRGAKFLQTAPAAYSYRSAGRGWRVVGHQIEYFVAVPEPDVRGWLDRLDGFYCSDAGDVPFSWEGQLRSGGTFWAHMAAAACNFSLAMNYSGLWSGWPPAVDFARRFEAELWEQVGPVPLLRIDEFLVGEWFRAVGREWEQFERPTEELAAWLRARDEYDDHWDLLSPEQRQAEPDAVADGGRDSSSS